MPEMELEWMVPAKSNAIERDRARSYHQAYSAAVAMYNLDTAFKEVRAGRTKSWESVQGAPQRPSASASTRPRAACSRTTW